MKPHLSPIERDMLRKGLRQSKALGLTATSSSPKGNGQGQTLKIGPLPMVPPSGNVMRRKYRHPHAYKRLRESWQRTIWAFLPPGRRSYETVEQKMRVTVTIEHGRLYDADNAVSGCKPVLDSLTNLVLIRDDSPEWMELDVRQVKGRENMTLIEIEPL